MAIHSEAVVLLTEALTTAFDNAGEELFVVGGAVRDNLLGIATADCDFATSAPPEKTVALLNSLGYTPYRVGEKFGTIGVALEGGTVEITTYRSRETYHAGSRKPDVSFGTSLQEDLSRRDFTINAMARRPGEAEVIDPLGGQVDIERRCIRAVGDPNARFREDPLRILRAIRFAARLDYSLEQTTWEALRELAPLLTIISRERIRDEFSRILTEGNAVHGLTLIRTADVFTHTVPELEELVHMPDHGPRHPLSLWEHVMRVIAGTGPDLVLRWAALLHDIGKPSTRTQESTGRPRFFHHEEVGAVMAKTILRSLRYSSDFVEDVHLLVETHMQLHTYSSQWSEGAIRRLMLRLGPLTNTAIQLARADAAGHTDDGSPGSMAKFDELQGRIDSQGRERVAGLRSPLTGEELMEHFGRDPGPWIRTVKDALLNRVIEGSLGSEDREEACIIAEEIVRSAQIG